MASRTNAFPVPVWQPTLGARSPSVRMAWRLIRTQPLGVLSAILLVAIALGALLAPQLAPYDPFEIHRRSIFSAPGGAFILGTDDLGRDVLSRILYGARISLVVGLVAVGVGNTLGALIGLVSGYAGRRADAILQRSMDVLMSFPSLVLAMAVVSALGRSVTNIILAIAILEIPRASRVIRSVTLAEKQKPYVEAARCVGCRTPRILFGHVAVQVLAPFLVMATAGLGGAILTEASLSFLGLGPPPPSPSWGAMLSGPTVANVEAAPWLAIFPGVALSVTVLAFNLVGDSLRDFVDPRLR